MYKRKKMGADRIAVELKRKDMVLLKDCQPIIHVVAKYSYNFDRICSAQVDKNRYEKDLKKLIKSTAQEKYFVQFIVKYPVDAPGYFKYWSKNMVHVDEQNNLNTLLKKHNFNIVSKTPFDKVGKYMGFPIYLRVLIATPK